MSTKLAPWNWFDNDARDTVPMTPLTPVDELHNEIDRLFQNVFRGFASPWGMMRNAAGPVMKEMALRPRLDMTGDDKQYVVTVEIPGVSPDDISLEARDGALLLRGEKKQEATSDEKGVYRMERTYGSFERVLPLPEDASEDAVTASHKDGADHHHPPQGKNSARGQKNRHQQGRIVSPLLASDQAGGHKTAAGPSHQGVADFPHNRAFSLRQRDAFFVGGAHSCGTRLQRKMRPERHHAKSPATRAWPRPPVPERTFPAPQSPGPRPGHPGSFVP